MPEVRINRYGETERLLEAIAPQEISTQRDRIHLKLNRRVKSGVFLNLVRSKKKVSFC
jgi:hypothetical protein